MFNCPRPEQSLRFNTATLSKAVCKMFVRLHTNACQSFLFDIPITILFRLVFPLFYEDANVGDDDDQLVVVTRPREVGSRDHSQSDLLLVVL